MDYATQNKHIINGAFDSMGYEEIKLFFYNDIFSVIYSAIEQVEKELNVQLEPSFKNFLADFYTEASAGLLINWTKSKMSQDKEDVLQNLLTIFKISMPAILSNKGVPL